MALKRLHTIQVTISKDIASGEISANCQAVATLPEIDGHRIGVNLSIDEASAADIINSAIAALKAKMAEGGHTVEDAQPVED